MKTQNQVPPTIMTLIKLRVNVTSKMKDRKRANELEKLAAEQATDQRRQDAGLC